MSRVAAILRWLGRFGNSFRSDAASSPRPPHPANVPGPFYVEDGCCITCGVWEDIAPDLLAWTPDDDDRPHCFVARQPETDAEFGRMLRAMDAAEVACIRVRACRPDWAGRLRKAGLGDQIDPPDEPPR